MRAPVSRAPWSLLLAASAGLVALPSPSSALSVQRAVEEACVEPASTLPCLIGEIPAMMIFGPLMRPLAERAPIHPVPFAMLPMRVLPHAILFFPRLIMPTFV
jgi:hypothetical protein